MHRPYHISERRELGCAQFHWYIHSALQSFLTRSRKYAKIKDVFIISRVKKWLHITKFNDVPANRGPKIKLKGALSKERDNAGCKNWSMARTAAKNSEGLDRNSSNIGEMF